MPCASRTCASRARRASSRSSAPMPRPKRSEFSAVFEVYPESRSRRRRADRDRAAARGGHGARTSIARSTCCAGSGRRMPPVDRAAQAADRVRVDFTGTIDGVEFPGGQAKDFPISLGEGRMLPEFETAVTGMKRGRREIVRSDVSGRLSRSGSRRQDGAVRADGEGGRRAAGPRARRGVREGVRHRERRTSTTCARRSRRTSSSS